MPVTVGTEVDNAPVLSGDEVSVSGYNRMEIDLVESE